MSSSDDDDIPLATRLNIGQLVSNITDDSKAQEGGAADSDDEPDWMKNYQV